MWLHLAEAHLRQFEDDDVLARRDELDVLVRLEVSQAEDDADRHVDHELGDLERQRFDVHVLVQERRERDGDRVHHRERGAHDAKVAEHVELATQLHVDRHPAGVVQLVLADEAADLPASTAQQLNVVGTPLERLVHDEDHTAHGERLQPGLALI